jgi:Plasmid recombination enzyme
MAYAIMRWSKVTSQVQAEKATGHNYRTDRVDNADKEAPHPNVELVNMAGRGYWELAEERIAEAVTRKVRDDQVRCMEVILTASPEFFERDANGRAADMSQSQWFKDQLTFLEKTFGKENVLSCTLHQDEKSPHVHAVIAPITEDGRLSAKDLFNPKTLTDYQSQYAEAMTVHGLVRGVDHSQAEHLDMKRMYAQQAQTASELSAQLGPASSYQDVQVKRPGAKDLLNLSEWEARTTAQVNEKARAQVEEANKRAEKAQNLALENAAVKDQVRVLQKQLSTSEKLKEANYEKFKGERAKVDDLAMRAAGGEPASPEIIERGKQLLNQGVQDVQQSRERVAEVNEKADQAEKKGDYGQVAELRFGTIQEVEKRLKEQETNLRAYVGGATRLDQLDEQQAQERDEKAKKQAEGERQAAEQARLDREAAEQKRIDQANLAAEQTRLAQEAAARQAQEQAQQKAENERQKPIIRENERQQIERISMSVLQNDPHIYRVEHMDDALKKAGVDVWIVDSKRRIALTGSENEFSTADIRPGGRAVSELVSERMAANSARVEREIARDNDRERD